MYKLTHRAVDDFESIYEYPWKKFGSLQADKYAGELDLLFTLLAKNPVMGHDTSNIKEGTRQVNHRQHAIFYQNTDYGVLIIRILHHQMDPMRHFT